MILRRTPIQKQRAGEPMPNTNQTPEEAARDIIDRMLSQAGWFVQDNKKTDFSAGFGIAVCEYQTDVGPADYVLFIDKKPVGVVEAKPEDWGQKITTVEDQSGRYAAAKLKWVKNKERLPFICESTGVLTRFTDGRDPKPRSIQFCPAGDDAGLAHPAGLASFAAPGASGPGYYGAEGMPDQGHQEGWRHPSRMTAHARHIPRFRNAQPLDSRVFPAWQSPSWSTHPTRSQHLHIFDRYQ